MTPETLAIIVLIGAFVILIAHNIPIAFAIGISTVLSYLCLWPDRPMLVFMQVSKDMWHGIDSYALLAIPMFVLRVLVQLPSSFHSLRTGTGHAIMYRNFPGPLKLRPQAKRGS